MGIAEDEKVIITVMRLRMQGKNPNCGYCKHFQSEQPWCKKHTRCPRDRGYPTLLCDDFEIGEWRT